jgi:hypothetical protein
MTDPSLQALIDRQAITEVIYRYGRALDRMDYEMALAVWHEDGLADYGEEIYQGSGHGFVDYVFRMHQGMIAHQHLVGNILIELDGDFAVSESYYHASHRIQDGETLKQTMMCGRYLDRWSRREGRWAIDQRQTISDFDDIRIVTTAMTKPRGTRDRTDPSHALFASRGRG